MRKTLIRCEATNTYASIIGNMTSFAKNYFINHFPSDFFKDVFISESLNSNNLDTNDEVRKLGLPRLIIKPELANDNLYVEKLPYWYKSDKYIAGESGRKTYQKVFSDPDSYITIYTIPQRTKVNFTFKIIVPTVMYMWNIINKMKTMFEATGYEYVNQVPIQTEIPKKLMINLAKYKDFNLDTPEGRKLFNDYLSSNSMTRLSENINLSNGNNNYAYTYKTNILVNYPDEPTGDKNSKNLVVGNASITFQMSLETWFPNKFLLELPDDNFDFVETEIVEDDETFKFNIVVDTDYIMPKINDKHLLLRSAFLPDVNVEYDVLDFSSIITSDIKEIISVLLHNDYNINRVFDFKVMCGNKLIPDLVYKIDYHDFILKTIEPMSNVNYTILIYGNIEKMKNIADLIKLNRIDEIGYVI